MMQKRRSLSFFLPVCCLLFLLTSCGPVQGPPASHPVPTATVGPSFEETTPLVIRPPLFAVNSVAWSPDGKRVAIANADGVFQVWEAATGRLVSTHYQDGRSTDIVILGWSSDSKRIISTSLSGNTVQVWDATTGKTLLSFRGYYPFAASHDGRYVAFALENRSTVQIWNTSTGSQSLTIDTHATRVAHVVWSPYDNLLAITSLKRTDGSFNATAGVWDAATGAHISTYQGPSGGDIFPLVWSPDGQRLVSELNFDSAVEQVWDAASGEPILAYHGTSGHFASLAWSPDGRHIASWYTYEPQGRLLQVWDAATGNLSFTFGQQDQSMTSVAWSPDGRRIAVAGQQMKLQVLDAATGQTCITYQGTDNQNIVTWSPGGQYLASAGEGGTTTWEATADQRITSIAARHQVENAVTWSPNGKQIAAEDGSTFDAGFWDAVTGGNMGDLSLYHEAMLFFFYRNTAAVGWSPDGAHVAQAMFPPLSNEIHVSVWNSYEAQCGLDENCPVSGGSHSAPIAALAWSPDSKHIASGSADKTVLIYDVVNQKNLLIYRGHTDAVTAVAWSPDGKYIASGSADKTIQIWDATSGKRVLTLSGHTGAVTAVAWSPDSKRVASSSEDGTVRIWDAVHGKLILTYGGHAGAVMAVAWSPSGRYIASGGVDTTVQVWDANTGKAAFVYRGHSDAVLAVAWSPESKRVASAGADGTIQIW